MKQERVTVSPSLRRVLLLLASVVLVFSLTAPGFATAHNLATLAKGTAALALLVAGFTLVMLCGQLDLSVASLMVMGAMLAVKWGAQIGWTGGLLVAAAFGVVAGALNGVLVARIKVDSFIATLGTLTVWHGVALALSDGDSLQVANYNFGQWLDSPLFGLPYLAPIVLLALLGCGIIEFALGRSVVGRHWYLIGSSPRAAWSQGLPVERLLLGAFVVSGVCAALGGALYAALSGAATVHMGDAVLMQVVAATIVGGTSMTGGRGSITQSVLALGTLTALTGGFSLLGVGAEIQKIISGLVLGGIITTDAVLAARAARTRSMRPELLNLTLATSDAEENDDIMNAKKDQNLAIVCVTAIACTAIVAIFAMFFVMQSRPSTVLAEAPGTNTSPSAKILQNGTSQNETVHDSANGDEALANMKASDGQPLFAEAAPRPVPPRPKDPAALPETDAGHWWDMEYAGEGVKKVNIPPSKGDGPQGKTVIYLKFVDHPYLTAYSRGLERIAKKNGIRVKTLVANGDINLQARQAEQAIAAKPDLVIVNPLDAKACVPYLRKLNEAKIPVIAANLLPVNDALQYVVCWTGPDDWKQMRALAREFARRMNYQGGYCIVRHFPGGSPYFSRTFSVVTELSKIAPKMKLLAMETTDLDANKTRPVVVGWLKRFGKDLKGIMSADDSGAQVGINQACADENRQDVIRVAAGNSKVGMDFIQDGSLAAVNYQSPEADGALPMQMAVDYFNGKTVPPIRYLPIRLITKENVKQFLPPQW